MRADVTVICQPKGRSGRGRGDTDGAIPEGEYTRAPDHAGVRSQQLIRRKGQHPRHHDHHHFTLPTN